MGRVAVRRCAGYRADELKRAALGCFDAFGGIGEFIARRDTVLLKPNLLARDPASAGTTTHPAFVAAVAELVMDMGARPVIGDSPAFGSCRQVAARCGLLKEAERLGVQVVELRRNAAQNGAKLTGSLREYPIIINLPKLKAHAQLGFTCGVKNLFGLVEGKSKAYHHLAARGDVGEFSRLIIEVALKVAPAFTVVDAVDVMTGTGPRRGFMKRAGLVLGAADPLSVDAAAKMIFNIPQTPILDAAINMGLEHAGAGSVSIEGTDGLEIPLAGFEFPGDLKDVSFSVPRVALSLVRHLAIKFWGR